MSFSLIALSKYHVFHKGKDIHIGHAIVSGNSAELPRFLGSYFIVFGFLSMLLYILIFTLFTGIIALFLAVRHHLKFKSEMDKLMGAKEALEDKGNA